MYYCFCASFPLYFDQKICPCLSSHSPTTSSIVFPFLACVFGTFTAVFWAVPKGAGQNVYIQASWDVFMTWNKLQTHTCHTHFQGITGNIYDFGKLASSFFTCPPVFLPVHNFICDLTLFLCVFWTFTTLYKGERACFFLFCPFSFVLLMWSSLWRH